MLRHAYNSRPLPPYGQVPFVITHNSRPLSPCGQVPFVIMHAEVPESGPLAFTYTKKIRRRIEDV
jgi:hypothetical protein